MFSQWKHQYFRSLGARVFALLIVGGILGGQSEIF